MYSHVYVQNAFCTHVCTHTDSALYVDVCQEKKSRHILDYFEKGIYLVREEIVDSECPGDFLLYMCVGVGATTSSDITGTILRVGTA